MISKKYTGRFISIEVADRKNRFDGYYISSSKDWSHIKFNSEDYMCDGFLIIPNKKIVGIRYSKNEKWTEKVMNLKKLQPKKSDAIPLDDMETILRFLTKKYGAFMFDLKSTGACYLGRLTSISKSELIIDFLNTNGTWGGSMKFRPNSVRSIFYNTDYINSLLLVGRKNKKHK